jgi:hypothetical protein
MTFASPMGSGNFRAAPLNFTDEECATFVKGVSELNVDLLNRTLDFRLHQTEDPTHLGIIWKVLEEKTSFQIDAYTHRNVSIFSIILLDCQAVEHNFGVSMNSQIEGCFHSIAFEYRAHVRFGPSGNLSITRDDKVEDRDRMMAKLLFRSPMELF